METRLDPALLGTTAGSEARSIVERCVHCGFCNATCPTFQLLGDELDGPRGRIYLMKKVLEGAAPTARTRLHLDRCLTCRACETTCPSGVEYGRLLEIGRTLVEERVPRPLGERLLRRALPVALTSRLFAPALRALQSLRPLLGRSLRSKIPRPEAGGVWPERPRPRRMLLLAGCVQPALFPNINAATARVLDAAGIQLIVVPGSGCCGALRHHLADASGGLADARRNLDAWWPAIEAGAEAIVMNASGCGAMVRDYAHLLRADPHYAARAARIVALTRDVSEIVAAEMTTLTKRARRSPGPAAPVRVVFHSPCTLQHGQRIQGKVEALLTAFGAQLLPAADGQLCCGSAGTYSLLQPAIAGQLRERKLTALTRERPEAILSANVGCIGHLGGAAAIPVMHWIEWLDAHLGDASP